MKVCHIAPLVEPLGDQPPGGAEHFVRLLAGMQLERGYDVTVIATRGSLLPAGIAIPPLDISGGRLIPIKTGLSEDEQRKRADLDAVFEAELSVFAPAQDFLSARQGEFDVVHNHAYDYFPLVTLDALDLPLLHTLHLPPLLPWVNERLRAAAEQGKSSRYVCVSESAKLHYLERTGLSPRVIPCGLSFERIPTGGAGEDFFLWVGRISREKGLHTAIRTVCEKLGERLVVIGRVYDEAYFRTVEPMLAHPLVDYLGALPNDEVLGWMRRAAALVLPLEWDEPFGLVMIEALAAGTPVIASPRGAAPEIIEEAVTGFLASDDDEVVSALRNVRRLDRARCRPSVEHRYSLSAMAAAYDEVYRTIAAVRA